jgi:peptidyl-prolyl cis-trans isomerase A (cyclophilin A)
MKALLILCISGAVLAQTPPPVKKAPATAAPAAKAPATTAPATKAAPAAARPNPLMNPAALKAIAPELYRVKFTTTHGDFTVEVHRDWAPLGADRFYNLVKNRFFSDAAFFRYVPNFIVQFGLPADPKVAAVWQSANIKDDPVKQGNTKGTVVFATAGPGTRTTQLFVNLNDNTRSLDAQGFSAFGTVTEGMDVVQGLYSGYGEQPNQGAITAQGKAYLDKSFPKLDSIKSATVIFPEPAAPAVKKEPAAAGAAGTPAKSPAPATKSAPPPPAPPAKKQ